MRVRDMTQGSPMRLIWVTALPLMLGNAFQQLYTVVDASVVGRGIGLAALAALGSADWFNWLFLSAAQGFAQGFAIPIAQAFGARDFDELRRDAGSAALLAAALSLLLTALAQALVGPVLTLLGTQSAVRGMAEAYLRTLFSGLPVVLAFNLLAGMLRSLGDSQSPLWAMVMASLVNIALDLLFVMGLRWGVVGAAAATIIAQLASCLFCLARLRKVDFMRLSRRELRFDAARCAHLMGLGLPICLQNGTIAVGGMIVQRVVNPLGVAFIAGYTATNKLYGVLEMAAISFGYALSTYAGQNLGAKKIYRIRRGLMAGAVTGVIVAAGICGLMLAFGHLFVGLFIAPSPQAEAATAYALEFLRLMALCLPVLYILYIFRSTLQGMGNTIAPMVSGIVEFFMRTGSALLLPGLIGYSGLFWAEVLAWAGADLILIPRCISMLRRLERKA